MADTDQSLYNLRFNQVSNALEGFGGGSPMWTLLTLTNVDPTQVPVTRLINTTAPLTGGGNLSADRTLSIPAATGSVDGYLTHTDWTTFNSKLGTALPSMNLLVGNASDIATASAVMQIDLAHNSVGINTAPDTTGNYDLKATKGIITAGNIQTTGGNMYTNQNFICPDGGGLATSGSHMVIKPSGGNAATGVQFQDLSANPILTLNTSNLTAIFAGAPQYPTSTNSSATGTVTPASALGVVTYLYTVTGDLTINGPANGYDGQKITFRLLQDGTGHSVTFASGSGNFAFGTTITSFTASAANLTDYVGCIWDATASRWHIVSVSQGF